MDRFHFFTKLLNEVFYVVHTLKNRLRYAILLKRKTWEQLCLQCNFFIRGGCFLKQYIKIYFITSLISVLFAAILWFLPITAEKIFEIYSIPFTILILVGVWIGLSKCIEKIKPKIIIFLLNPVLYYLIALITINILFRIEALDSSGFSFDKLAS